MKTENSKTYVAQKISRLPTLPTYIELIKVKKGYLKN